MLLAALRFRRYHEALEELRLIEESLDEFRAGASMDGGR